jgi:hypothetical protein
MKLRATLVPLLYLACIAIAALACAEMAPDDGPAYGTELEGLDYPATRLERYPKLARTNRDAMLIEFEYLGHTHTCRIHRSSTRHCSIG